MIETAQWMQEITRHALFMSKDIRKAFYDRIENSLKVLPKDERSKVAQLNIFLSHLFATSVQIATETVNCSAEFENDVIAGIRRDFANRRRKALEGKGDGVVG